MHLFRGKPEQLAIFDHFGIRGETNASKNSTLHIIERRILGKLACGNHSQFGKSLKACLWI